MNVQSGGDEWNSMKPRSVLSASIVLLASCFAASQQDLPIIEAVHKGHAVGNEQIGIDAVRTVLAAGGKVDETDNVGWTPLMHAALECRPGIMKLLLQSGADVNHTAADGATALYVASDCFIARRRAQLAPE